MVLDDLEQVFAIEKDAFPDLFPSTSFRSELKRSRAEYFVAYAIKDIVVPMSKSPSNTDQAIPVGKEGANFSSGSLVTGKWLTQST